MKEIQPDPDSPIKVEVDGPVAIFRLARPHKRNALFAQDGAAYGPALSIDELARVEKVVVRPPPSGSATPLSDLLKGDRSVDIDAAHARVGPETLAKIIFTSGSTGSPKGVFTTHGMLCVNQAQMAAVNPVFTAARPSSSTGCRGTTSSAAATS